MKLEDLTIKQLVLLSAANDIDANEFAARALRFTRLAMQTSYTQGEAHDLRNLHDVLQGNLNNAAFVNHLVEVIHGPVEVIRAL
jgi:signal transduction histidine kinase